jgi:hypothetical protein
MPVGLGGMLFAGAAYEERASVRDAIQPAMEHLRLIFFFLEMSPDAPAGALYFLGIASSVST